MILVTGAAGFIGFHLSLRLLNDGYEVIGFDNLNDYYDVSLKESRLEILRNHEQFHFVKGDLIHKNELINVFQQYNIEYIVNLAAQAGVRYSLDNPQAYVDSNITGFLNVLECARENSIKHVVYASSSSVYGGNDKVPFSTADSVDNPISMYAVTKKTNELMAHTYSHLFKIPTTGLRFFTVYGPYGRPDMALFLFTKAILEKQEIKVFNHGKMERDFTYVDDIVESISRLIVLPPVEGDNTTTKAPYKVYNIGNNNPVKLEKFIDVIEDEVGISAIRNYMPLQPGDVPKTYAEVQDLYDRIDFKPETSIENGVKKFVKWYREYYKE